MVRPAMRLAALLALLLLAPDARSARPDPSAAGPFHVGITTRTFVDATRARTLVTEKIVDGSHSGLLTAADASAQGPDAELTVKVQ